MAVNIDPVLNTSVHRPGCSSRGESLALVWKDAMLTVHFCIWEGYCLQFLQTGSEFLEGTKQMGYTEKEGGWFFSYMLEVSDLGVLRWCP